MPGLSESLKVAGASRNQFNAWNKDGLFTTKWAETDPGVARELSRENVLELALMAAFVATGLRPSTAAAYVASFLRQDSAGRLREWLVYPAGTGAERAVAADHIDPAKLTALAAEGAPPALVLIPTGEILRRVDRLCEVRN